MPVRRELKFGLDSTKLETQWRNCRLAVIQFRIIIIESSKSTNLNFKLVATCHGPDPAPGHLLKLLFSTCIQPLACRGPAPRHRDSVGPWRQCQSASPSHSE